MYKLITTIVLLHMSVAALAQSGNTFFADNNPKITDTEAVWLDKHFKVEDFSFKGKEIQFLEMQGPSKELKEFKKKNLKDIDTKRKVYRLIGLIHREGETNKIYDAVLVFTDSSWINNLYKIKKRRITNHHRLNRYIVIPPDAGKDNNALLSTPNATFLNNLYQSQIYPRLDVDFTGKKIAIFDGRRGPDDIRRISIPEYVDKIREEFEYARYAYTDWTYKLKDEEKSRTGGYDLIIMYYDKPPQVPLSAIIEILYQDAKITANNAPAQPGNNFFANNNPKITDTEAIWLDKHFKVEGFSFKGKFIQFAKLTIYDDIGISKYVNWYPKSKLKNIDLENITYRTFIIFSSTIDTPKGFDAILVFTDKRWQKKLERLKLKKLDLYTRNRYIQIPDGAGKDSNAMLSEANAVFFNRLYQSQLNYKGDIGFIGKKIAIFDGRHGYSKIKRITIPEYIRSVRDRLEKYGYAQALWARQLNEEQKEYSNGFDIILMYPDKGPYTVQLVDILDILHKGSAVTTE